MLKAYYNSVGEDIHTYFKDWHIRLYILITRFEVDDKLLSLQEIRSESIKLEHILVVVEHTWEVLQHTCCGHILLLALVDKRRFLNRQRYSINLIFINYLIFA